MSSVGALGVVGLGKESTFGTGVAASKFFPFTSEGFRDGPEAVQEAQIRGILDQAPKYKGMQIVSGQLAGAAYPSEVGDILRAALGAPVTTGAGPYNHVFTPPQSAFSSDAALPPYSVVVDRGAQVRRYTGCVCSGVTFNFSQGGLLTFDSSWIGQDSATIAAPTPTLPTDDPFQVKAAVTRDGSSWAYLQDFSISIQTAIEALRLINNTDLIARIAFSGVRTIGLSGTADFATTDLYDDFKGFGTKEWTFAFTVGTKTLTFTVPTTLISDAGAQIGGEGRVTLSFTGDAMYDTSTSKALEVELVNDTATY